MTHDDTTDDTNGPDVDRRAAAVSAVVDGVATAEERALVDADPRLRADVDLLTAVKSTLGDVPRLDDGHRDHLLGAALAAFDEGRGSGSVAGGAGRSFAPPPPPAVRHRGATRWLAAAAAVVALVGTAGVAVTLISGGSDEDAVNTDNAESFTEDEPGVAGNNEEDASTGGNQADDAPATTSAGTSPSEGPTATPPVTTQDVDNAAPDSTASPSQQARTAIDNETDLTNWVIDVQDGLDVPPSAGATECGLTILGEARYRGAAVYVAIDGTDVVAYDTDTCGEVLRTDAP